MELNETLVILIGGYIGFLSYAIKTGQYGKSNNAISGINKKRTFLAITYFVLAILLCFIIKPNLLYYRIVIIIFTLLLGHALVYVSSKLKTIFP